MGFLTVLLTVLKIIGIVLASIVGLIIFLLLVILLAPVGYKGRIKYDSEIDIKLKAWYLFGIVRAYFIKTKDSQKMDAKILWFSLLNKKDKKKRSRRSKDTKVAVKETEVAYRDKADEPDAEKPGIAQWEPLPENVYPGEDVHKQDKESDSDEENTSKETKNKKSILNRIKDIYNNIIDKINTIREKLKELLDKKDKLMAEINDADNREAVSFSLGIVRKLLVHVLPRNHRIYIKFGMDDPATTGEILGATYAVGALIGLNLVIEPDFEHKVFECDIPFRGHVCLFRVLIWGIQMYRNKKFRKLLGKFNR